MKYLPTLINALVVAAMGALVTFITRTQIQDVRREIGGVRTEVRETRRELRSEISAVRSELKTEIGAVRSEMAVMRSDLTQVALAVGVRPRPQTG